MSPAKSAVAARPYEHERELVAELMRWEDDGGRGARAAKPSPPPNLVPVEHHDRYALLWDLADEMAGKDRNLVERCWLRIMDAFWSGELPTLLIFFRPQDIFAPGRVLTEFDRNTLAAHLLGCLARSEAMTDADFAALLGWALADYQRQPEPFRSYFTRNPRFGLAVRRDDFERWLAKSSLPPWFEPQSAMPLKSKAGRKSKLSEFQVRYWGREMPTHKAIANEFGVNERTVGRWIRTLKGQKGQN
jgi:hypothetical protein